MNEWPARDVGVFISIGTGKRPHGSDQNQHLWYEGFMGDFAEARRQLIAKIEGCEETHQYMVKEGLAKRGVNIENYYRFNVEIGVGEFGMNEWNRLADISTGTRRYLGKSEVQRMNIGAAAKLAKIHKAKLRFEADRNDAVPTYKNHSLSDVPEAYPGAVELPADIPAQPRYSPPPRPSYESGHHDTLEVPSNKRTPSPRSSSENQPLSQSQNRPAPKNSVPDPNDDRLIVHAPTPGEYRTAGGADKIAIVGKDDLPRPSQRLSGRVEPPPLPPKTPIQDNASLVAPRVGMGRPRPQLPYPDDDGPPPVVNMARKPDYKGR